MPARLSHSLEGCGKETLSSLLKEELYEECSRRNLSNLSRANKDELVNALLSWKRSQSHQGAVKKNYHTNYKKTQREKLEQLTKVHAAKAVPKKYKRTKSEREDSNDEYDMPIVPHKASNALININIKPLQQLTKNDVAKQELYVHRDVKDGSVRYTGKTKNGIDTRCKPNNYMKHNREAAVALATGKTKSETEFAVITFGKDTATVDAEAVICAIEADAIVDYKKKGQAQYNKKIENLNRHKLIPLYNKRRTGFS